MKFGRTPQERRYWLTLALKCLPKPEPPKAKVVAE